ncbi:MAG: hypothetical protein U0U46_08115 [Saprospiraceae bacterium]
MPRYSYPTDFTGTLWRLFDGDVYVSYAGQDRSGSGHPKKPFATLQYALDQAVAGQKIVVGTGRYNEQVDGRGKNCLLQADGTVEMFGAAPGGPAFTKMGAGAVVSGFKITGYASCTNDVLLRFEDCFIHRSALRGAADTLLRCVVKDVQILAAVSNFLNCTFITVQKPEATGGITVENCHFGPECHFAFSSAALQVFNYCNQEAGSVIRIDNTAYSNAAAVFAAWPRYQEHGLSVAPLFNLPAIHNYTLSLQSPLIQAGSHSQPIGAFPQAISYDTKPKKKSIFYSIIFDKDQFVTLPDKAQAGYIESYVIDLLKVRVVGRIDLFAEQDFSRDFLGSVTANPDTGRPPRPITFQMRYADDQRRIQRQTYQDFIWDKMPTVDAKGQGNGNPTFDSLTEKPVLTRYVQLRVILRHGANIQATLQENGGVEL